LNPKKSNPVLAKKEISFAQYEIPIEDRVLKPEDVLETVREIIRLNNDPTAQPDQIDHLGKQESKTVL